MTTDPADQPATIRVSLDWLKLASMVLLGVGLISSLQLAWLKHTRAVGQCPPLSGMECESVVSSAYAQVGPVPVVDLGVAGYLLIGAALLFEARLPAAKMTTFGLTLFGFLFSAYLTAIEAFVLHKWCQLCLFIALAMTSLCGVSFIRLWRSVSAIPDDDDDEPIDETV